VATEGDWKAIDLNEIDLGHVFRMFTQNDPSFFAKP
jgi:hypothetical protein